MTDAPQGATLTADWERMMADYHRGYPEVQPILDIFAEAERIHREALLAMQPVKVWLSDHTNTGEMVPL